MPDRRVAIVGGGIAGLTLANCLARRGIEFEAVEIDDAFHPVGAGIGLSSNAMAVLRKLGLGDDVAARGAEIRKGYVGTSTGRILSGADTAALAPRFGSSIAIHRADLSDALAGGLPAGAYRMGTTVTVLEDRGDGVDVTFGDGREARFDAVVGADGIGSSVREMAVAPRERIYSGYTCSRLVVDFEVGELSGLGELWGPGSRFGMTPIGGGRLYCFAVWNAPRHREEPSAGLAERLRARFAGYTAPIPAILAKTADADVYHADIDELAEGPWIRGRVALIGDAAHAMTPNMGQGAAMGIEDAWVLCEELAAPGSVAEAFSRYEAARRPRVAMTQRRSRSLGRAAHLESRALAALRNLAVSMVPTRVAERTLASFLEESPVIVPGI